MAVGRMARPQGQVGDRLAAAAAQPGGDDRGTPGHLRDRTGPGGAAGSRPTTRWTRTRARRSRRPRASTCSAPTTPGGILFSRVIYGAQISLRVGLISVGIGGGIGIVLGIIAGYRGGVIDNVIMRVMDLLLAFPGILLALAIIAILGPGLFNVMIAVGISAIPSYTRVARGGDDSLRDREFVLGARAIGCGDMRITLRYILPNVLPPLIVLATLGIAGAILTAAGLELHRAGCGAARSGVGRDPDARAQVHQSGLVVHPTLGGW